MPLKAPLLHTKHLDNIEKNVKMTPLFKHVLITVTNTTDEGWSLISSYSIGIQLWIHSHIPPSTHLKKFVSKIKVLFPFLSLALIQLQLGTELKGTQHPPDANANFLRGSCSQGHKITFWLRHQERRLADKMKGDWSKTPCVRQLTAHSLSSPFISWNRADQKLWSDTACRIQCDDIPSCCRSYFVHLHVSTWQ